MVGKSLDTEPFSYRETKDGLLQVAFHGKVVTTLRGQEAARVLQKLQSPHSQERQLAMAKASGHFKHGNERAGKK